jgi:prevent-host-death family protein
MKRSRSSWVSRFVCRQENWAKPVGAQTPVLPEGDLTPAVMYVYLSDISWEGQGHPMSTISIRDLQRNTSGVVADVANSKHTALVTRHGEPIAALVPIDAQDLEDYLLSKVPGFAEDMAAADRAHADGEARSAADVFAELDAQDAGQ